MLKRWKKKFKNTMLSKKMLLIYALSAGVSCGISMAALQVSLNIYDEKLYEKSLQELDFFSQRVNMSLEELENISASIAMSPEMQEQLGKLKDMKYMSADYYFGLYYIREFLEDELIRYPWVQNVVYTDGNQAETKAGMDTGLLPQGQVEALMGQFHEARGGYAALNPTEEYPYLLSGRDVLERKNVSLDYLGSLLFTCDIGKIIEEENNGLEASHASLYVYSPDGPIYCNSQEQELFHMPKGKTGSGYEVIHYKGEKYFRCYLMSGDNGWTYVNVFPYSDIFGQTMTVRYLLLGCFLILFTGMVAVMRKLSILITHPLNQLSESMQIVETGRFREAKQVLDPEPGNDEAGLLTQEFGVMLDRIDELIHENYEKQLLLQDTKYKMLRAQINPHFLYNTLNTVNWLVKGGKNEDAGKVIMELGKLLRASFAENPHTTVREELETARGYLLIQEYRYRSRAEFQVEEEGELERYRIPRMVLQPLIENAIHYGVDNSLEICRITVQVKEEERGIFLAVEDTGPGITKEELEKIKDGTVVPKGHGIGIKNIRERLRITFADSEFEITSRPGQGTRVQIRIPKVEAEEIRR